MTARYNGLYRPSDRDLLKRAIRETAGRTGSAVFFAGLVNRTELTITEFFGTTTHGLKNLSVQPGEGWAGGPSPRRAPWGWPTTLTRTASPIIMTTPCASRGYGRWWRFPSS